jgi:hypothetical protein
VEILNSLEARWFLRESTPALKLARPWFEAVSPEPRRRDEYLLTGRDDIGFKARVVEGQPIKVETKYRLQTLGDVELAPSVVGRVEGWRKLSLSLDDPELRKQGAWRGLSKARWLRRFEYRGGEAREVSGQVRLEVGCGVELTELRWQSGAGAAEHVEWTLALEAFGAEAALLDVLKATCRAAQGSGLSLELGCEGSMSYPAWLGRTGG